MAGDKGEGSGRTRVVHAYDEANESKFGINYEDGSDDEERTRRPNLLSSLKERLEGLQQQQQQNQLWRQEQQEVWKKWMARRIETKQIVEPLTLKEQKKHLERHGINVTIVRDGSLRQQIRHMRKEREAEEQQREQQRLQQEEQERKQRPQQSEQQQQQVKEYLQRLQTQFASNDEANRQARKKIALEKQRRKARLQRRRALAAIDGNQEFHPPPGSFVQGEEVRRSVRERKESTKYGEALYHKDELFDIKRDEGQQCGR